MKLTSFLFDAHKRLAADYLMGGLAATLIDCTYSGRLFQTCSPRVTIATTIRPEGL